MNICPNCEGKGWVATNMISPAKCICGLCQGTGQVKDCVIKSWTMYQPCTENESIFDDEVAAVTEGQCFELLKEAHVKAAISTPKKPWYKRIFSVADQTDTVIPP